MGRSLVDITMDAYGQGNLSIDLNISRPVAADKLVYYTHCINGYINHYPDFIVQLDGGITVLLETKGDDRDNSDSRAKVELGRTWANKAGEQYRYFMVFNKQQMNGAVTVKELLQRLSIM